MSTQTVILHIPDELYARIRQRAEQSQRSVEAEFVSVLADALPTGNDLPSDLAEAIAPLDQLDDAELWDIASSRLPDETSDELQALHLKQQRNGLSHVEGERSDQLCLEYDRVMLIRARAAALLKERGHDVSRLLGS